MLLSHDELLELVAHGVITNVERDQVNAASIDISLGEKIIAEFHQGSWGDPYREVSLRDKEGLNTFESSCAEGGFILHPGRFILAHSQQVFNLPSDVSAEYKLKSSMARIGLDHCLAGWCDAGWNGSVLTLELKNVSQFHSLRLHHGDRIGQMIFFRHKPVRHEDSYAARGLYNGDRTATGIKNTS